jgi:hypothetical protein
VRPSRPQPTLITSTVAPAIVACSADKRFLRADEEAESCSSSP